MAATAWSFYNSFREYIGNGQFDLDGTSVGFYMALHTSAASANVNTKTLSTQASLGNEAASGNGYTTGGASVTSRTWASVATDKYRFDSTACVWTATGGTIANIKYAVIYQSGGKLVCFSKLTTSQFTLAEDNTLTVTPSASGIFELAQGAIMGLETASYISQLVATNPLATDPISQGDDHLRLIKSVLQTQFSGLSGTTAVTTSEAEMNILDGVTATSTELNYLDITTLGTSENSKVVTQSAGGVITVGGAAGDQVLNIASHDLVDGGLKLAGTLVTSSAAEINKLDGLGASTTELDYNDITTLGTVQTSKTVTADASGIVNHADYVVQRPNFKDYAETHQAIGSIGGGTQDIDLTSGNVVSGTVDTGTTTFTFSNPPASANSGSFTLILTNGGSQTVNWPGSVDWAAATAPTLTTSGVDVLTFTTIDGGTIWYGFAAGLAMA